MSSSSSLLSESVIGDDADIAFADNEIYAAQVEVQSWRAMIASLLHLASTLRRYATCYSLNCACATCFQILFPVSIFDFHFLLFHMPICYGAHNDAVTHLPKWQKTIHVHTMHSECIYKLINREWMQLTSLGITLHSSPSLQQGQTAHYHYPDLHPYSYQPPIWGHLHQLGGTFCQQEWYANC